jgi:hypothetical protein
MSTEISGRFEFGHKRSSCSCRFCVRNCRFIPGYLIPADLNRLVPGQGEIQVEDWAREHLRASPGAVVARVGPDGVLQTGRIPTLVPASWHGHTCHWLGPDNRCQVHANAPFGCAFFDCHSQGQECSDLSRQGLMEIVKDFQTGGLYSRLWNLLQTEGLTVSPVEDRRALMRAIEL